MTRDPWAIARVDKADELDFQFKVNGIKGYLREYAFWPSRKWRLDFAFFNMAITPLAVEVAGGVYLPAGGGHTRGKAFEDDCEKFAHLAMAGWRLIVVTPRQVKSGVALQWIERALE
jgi:hypothetical protein